MKKLFFLIPVLAIASCQPEAEKPAAADQESAPEAPADPAIDVSKPDSLVGKPLAKVKAACDAAEVIHRVVEIDGQPQIITMDFRTERLNFAVKDGVIIKVTTG
jgi:hypothetical protein|tara:strand:- start:11440 stop:11751 length:312 start_codon:yes stop_codon:yes gene_type:complete